MAKVKRQLPDRDIASLQAVLSTEHGIRTLRRWIFSFGVLSKDIPTGDKMLVKWGVRYAGLCLLEEIFIADKEAYLKILSGEERHGDTSTDTNSDSDSSPYTESDADSDAEPDTA